MTSFEQLDAGSSPDRFMYRLFWDYFSGKYVLQEVRVVRETDTTWFVDFRGHSMKWKKKNERLYSSPEDAKSAMSIRLEREVESKESALRNAQRNLNDWRGEMASIEVVPSVDHRRHPAEEVRRGHQ